MKKVLSVMLVIVLVLSFLPCSSVFSFAEQPVTPQTCAAELEAMGVDLEQLKSTLRTGLENCEKMINISAFSVPYSERGMDLINNYINGYMPEYFHICSTGAASYDASVMNYFVVYYADEMNTATAFAAARAEVEATTQQMLQGIAGNEALSEAEKALLVHDRLISYTSYDRCVLEGESVPDASRTIYGVFHNRTAVCEGYSKAYCYLLNQIGIPTMYVSSDLMDHAWNIVYIDNVPYYVDCTWDDPIPSYEGNVRHTNFLRSASGIVATGHSEGGEIDYAPGFDMNNTAYDNAYWQNSNTEFQLVGNKLYYLDNAAGALKSATTGETLCAAADQWYISQYGYYATNFARLDAIGEELFFSLSESIYRYNISTGKCKKIFTPDSAQFGDYYRIYGFKCEGRTMYCYLGNDANCNLDTVENYLITHEYAQYALTVDCDAAQGSVEVTGEPNELADILLTATPQAGYNFSGFYVGGTMLIDDDPDSNPLTVGFELTGDTAITALFKRESGSGTLRGVVNMSGIYKELTAKLLLGQSVVDTATVTPNGGFVFENLPEGDYTLQIGGSAVLVTTVTGIHISSNTVTDLRSSSNPALRRISLAQGDVNADKVVDIGDISRLLGKEVFGGEGNFVEDMNIDGKVDILDISILLQSENFAQTETMIAA